MKNKIIFIFSGLLIILAITGCTKKEEETTVEVKEGEQLLKCSALESVEDGLNLAINYEVVYDETGEELQSGILRVGYEATTADGREILKEVEDEDIDICENYDDMGVCELETTSSTYKAFVTIDNDKLAYDTDGNKNTIDDLKTELERSLSVTCTIK